MTTITIDNYRKRNKEQKQRNYIKYEAKKIKSENLTRSIREKTNIAILKKKNI